MGKFEGGEYRKFNGKRYKVANTGSKTKMQTEAKRLRKAGYGARVTKAKRTTVLYVSYPRSGKKR